MKYRIYIGQEDAGQEGYIRTGGRKDRRDEGQKGCRTGRMQDWTDAGEQGRQTGGIQDRNLIHIWEKSCEKINGINNNW